MCTKQVLPHMKGQKYGRIVNVSSLTGQVMQLNNCNTGYSANKAAIDAFTRFLAREVGDDGICVNAVAPGYIAASKRITDLWEKQDIQSVLSRVTLKRAGTAMETAKAIVFLASDDASYITGFTLDVNGGAVLG